MKSGAWVGSTVALAAVCAASLVFPQHEDRDRAEVIGGLAFKDEVEVTVVNVDVSVCDQKGRPVIGLDREDFRILQDGQERVISHFAPYTEEVVADQAIASRLEKLDVPAGPAPEPGEPSEPPPPELKPIYVVLYVDSENLRPFDRNRVLSQMRGFLGEIMHPHVQVMVVSYHRSLDIVVPFSSNASEVMAGLRGLYQVSAARPERDTQRTQILRDLQRLREKGAARSAGQASQEVWSIQADIQSYADQTANDLEFALRAIREVTDSLAGVTGRKWLVYISNGLPMVPGWDLFHDFSQTYQAAASQTFMMKYDQSRWFESLGSAANAQGVSFLTIDASGLGSENRASAEYLQPVDPVTATIHLNNHQQTLQLLADTTGGRAILSANDITDGLEAFRENLFSYYSIGYSITATGGDRVHRIEVELPDHPDYKLSYRRSFVEKSAESEVQDEVISGLMYDLDNNPMRIEASTGAALPADKGRWMVPLEVRVPLESVALIPEGGEYVGKVFVFVGARDPQGRQSDLQRQEHEIRMPATDYASRRGTQVVIELKLLMEEGSHRIVTGVMDRITRQSSYHALSREVPG